MRPLLTVVLAGLGGWIASLSGLPLAWMIGAMLVMAIASLFGAPVEQPSGLMRYVRAMVGTMLGASITMELLHEFSEWWLSLVFLALTLLVMGGIAYILLRLVSKFDRPTATLCAIPGGIVEMILFSSQVNADQSKVAIVQALRIALTILILPVLITWILRTEVSRSSVSFSSGMSMPDWGWFSLCVILGVLAQRFLRIPAPLILGPLVLSAAIHLAGITAFKVPDVVTVFVQIFIGINVGGRFLGVTLVQLAGVVGAACMVVFTQISVAFYAALLVSSWLDKEQVVLILAYAPGGLAEMSLIAVAIGAEPALVGLHHVFRVILALLLGPLVAKKRKT